RAREDIDVAHPLLQRGGIHPLDLGTGDRLPPVADAEHLRDGRRGDLVIASNHRDPDAAAMTFLHRLDCLLPWRTEQSDQSEQTEIPRQVGWGEAAGLDPGTPEPRQSQDAFTLAGQLVRGLHEMLARERHRLSTDALLPITVFEDDLRRALD